jgi:D-mannonate dehydratase
MHASTDHQGIDRSRSCDHHQQIIKALSQAGANALSLGDFVAVFDWEREDQ